MIRLHDKWRPLMRSVTRYPEIVLNGHVIKFSSAIFQVVAGFHLVFDRLCRNGGWFLLLF